jgi:hypothetical protein
VTWVVWNLVLVHLEIVLVSVQGWSTVCTEHTIGARLPQVEPRFGPFGDSASLDARLVLGLHQM